MPAMPARKGRGKLYQSGIDATDGADPACEEAPGRGLKALAAKGPLGPGPRWVPGPSPGSPTGIWCLLVP